MRKVVKLIVFFLCLLNVMTISAQNQSKCGNSILVGNSGLVAIFNDTSYPYLRNTYDSLLTTFDFRDGISSIGNPVTGLPMLYSNSNNIYDTLGNIIMNGEKLTDSIIGLYYYGEYPQQSMFLPLDSGKYVCLVNNLTDSAYIHCWINNQCGGLQQQFDELRYNLIDMNANNGNGAVIVKNKVLGGDTKLHMKMCNMSACRHANGKDWWVLRPGVDSFTMYRFLITKDSVYGPFVQYWDNQEAYFVTRKGQMCFSADGTKYASVLLRSRKLVVGDFDRCTGLLSNEGIFDTPFFIPPDSFALGVAISPNNQFVYVSKYKNVFQLDLLDPDTSTAWYTVKQGCDSLVNGTSCYQNYGTLYLGPDGRIYVGHTPGNTGLHFSSINKPNFKGAACDWCNQCLKCPPPSNLNVTSTFANQPNYALGPTSNPDCFPLALESLTLAEESVMVYPNPNTGAFNLKSDKLQAGLLSVQNLLGQEVFSINLKEAKFNHNLTLPDFITNGVYSYKFINSNGVRFAGKITIQK